MPNSFHEINTQGLTISPSHVVHRITIQALWQSGIITNIVPLHNVHAKVPISIETTEFRTAGATNRLMLGPFSMAKPEGLAAIEMSGEVSFAGK